LRIGFVSAQDAFNVTSWSGIPFQIMEQLRANNADFDLLSPLRSRAKYLFAPSKLMAVANRSSVTLDHFPLVLRDYARQIERFAKERRIDVIFCTSTIPITLVDCGKPIITWTDSVFHAMHDYYGKAFANMTLNAIKRGKWQEKTALQNCTMAAFASTWALEGARELTGPEKLRVIPFGSSLPVQHTGQDIARQAIGKRTRRKNECELLFIGVNWQRKGGAIAVEVAKLLNENGIRTNLKVAGSRPEGEIPEFVEPLGFINKSSEFGMQKLIDLYRNADFFILPTQAEAAGIVFSEASSFGLPSITYATGGVTDYVRNGVNGVCLEAGAPAACFATEIRRILSSPSEYEFLANGAFREYEQRLNWSTSVKRLIVYCEECASR
jgi:glycosyltransferase involved in cell wall biosynthesis